MLIDNGDVLCSTPLLNAVGKIHDRVSYTTLNWPSLRDSSATGMARYTGLLLRSLLILNDWANGLHFQDFFLNFTVPKVTTETTEECF